MKTTRVIALLLTLIMTAGCIAAHGAETVYNLKIDYPNPENSAIYPVLVKWAEHLEEKSNGRIKARIYAAGALGSIVDCVTNCESGVTDGFWSAMNIYPGIWPLCDVFMLPMLGSNKMEVQIAAMQDMLKEKDFAAEWTNLKLVAMHSSTPSTFIFADSVDSIRAMQGKTVRTLSNYTTPWLEALGAIPVSVSSNDGYENIQKGVIQGGLWYLDQIQSSALYEVIKTCVYGETAWPCLFLALNKGLYEGMPEDLRKIVDESREYYLSLLPEAYYSQEALVIDLLNQAKVPLIRTSDADLAWLASQADKAYNAYIERVNGLGHDGKAVIDTLKGFIEKHNKEYPK